MRARREQPADAFEISFDPLKALTAQTELSGDMSIRTGINAAFSSILIRAFLHSSGGRVEIFLRMLEHLRPGRPEWRRSIREFRTLLRSGHPFKDFLARINRELSPRCRRKLIDNLLVRGWLVNREERKFFEVKEGFPPPIMVSFAPTSRCNLNCRNCSAAGSSEGEDIDPPLMRRIMDEAIDEMGIHFFTLTGGEPFVYPHLLYILESYPDCYFQIFTNGTLLDEETVARLSRLGNAILVISLEGFENRTDARRDKGTFREVLAAMGRLRRAGVPFGFGVMTTRESIDSVTGGEFVDWALEKGCLLGYYFHYMPVGRNVDLSLLPSPEQRDESRRNVYRLRNSRPIFLVDPVNDGPLTGGCTSSGRHYVHIHASGDVTPCVYNNFSPCNIKDSSLTEALRNPYLSTLRKTIPFEGNSLRCCFLLDRPKFFFRTLELFRPGSRLDGEMETMKRMKPELERYSARMKEIYDAAWKSGDWESLISGIELKIAD